MEQEWHTASLFPLLHHLLQLRKGRLITHVAYGQRKWFVATAKESRHGQTAMEGFIVVTREYDQCAPQTIC